MADPKNQQKTDFRRTLDEGPGVGQMSDGTFDTFPVADLTKRTAERDSQEAATGYAMEQSEEGYSGLDDAELRTAYEANLDADSVQEKA